METPNAASLSRWWKNNLYVSDADIVRSYRGFNAYSDTFRKESDRYEK
jgi:hypothetical protein